MVDDGVAVMYNESGKLIASRPYGDPRPVGGRTGMVLTLDLRVRHTNKEVRTFVRVYNRGGFREKVTCSAGDRFIRFFGLRVDAEENRLYQR
jgi:hypothetical protein